MLLPMRNRLIFIENSILFAQFRGYLHRHSNLWQFEDKFTFRYFLFLDSYVVQLIYNLLKLVFSKLAKQLYKMPRSRRNTTLREIEQLLPKCLTSSIKITWIVFSPKEWLNLAHICVPFQTDFSYVSYASAKIYQSLPMFESSLHHHQELMKRCKTQNQKTES